MIVVDSNIVAYLLLVGERTSFAQRVMQRDPTWAVPRLWRSEINNILAGYMRHGTIDLEAAQAISEAADFRLGRHTYDVPPPAVLSQVARSTCSAYDCEFVALAMDLGVPLVTEDRKVLNQYPTIAMDMETFLGRAEA